MFYTSNRIVTAKVEKMRISIIVYSSLLLLIIASGNSERSHPRDISSVKNSVEEPTPEVRQEKSWKSRNLRNLVDMAICVGSLDATCALDKADVMIVDANKSFWEEADSQAVESGRAEDETKPSALMDSLNSIISELTDMFQNGLAGLFRDAKESTSDDTELEEETDEDEDHQAEEKDKKKTVGVEESRGKKKKKRKAIIKLLLLGAVAATKIKLILKALAIHLQVKFLLIALAGLLLNAARFYLELKKGHQPQKVIYYEHAQHQHHYDGGEEDWHGGWSRRSYDEAKKSAQDMAYSQQKPQGLVYSKVNDKPNYSWD